VICFNSDCAKEFNAKTHNQKYCSDDCCRIATNKKIMEKYYEKKAIKNGAKRLCKQCKASLSRYNTEMICSLCLKSSNAKHNKKIMEALNDPSIS
jgi:hypothetical protein